MMQVDLFASLEAPAAPPEMQRAVFRPLPEQPVMPPLMPSPAWDALLARSTVAGDAHVSIMVMLDWTGVVVEVLADPALGRHFRYRDGFVREVGFTDRTYGRTLFLTQREAADLHHEKPLVRRGPPGTKAVMLRYAAAGDPIITSPWEFAPA